MPPNTRKRKFAEAFKTSLSAISNIFSQVWNWFIGPEVSGNDLTENDDATDSSSEEEDSPPAKRIAYMSTENSDGGGPSGVVYPSNNITSVKKSNNRGLRKLNYVSALNHSNKKNNNQPEDNDRGDEIRSVRALQLLEKSNRQLVQKKKNSIFKHNIEELCFLHNNGATEAVKNKIIKSGPPFHPGEKPYHGSTYMNEVNVEVTKTPDSNSNVADSHLSLSAKRIMNVLIDHTSLSKNLTTTSTSHNTQELHHPNMSSDEYLKRKGSSSIETTHSAQGVISSRGQTFPYPRNKLQRDALKRSNEKTSKTKSNKMSDISTIDHSNLPNLNFGITKVSEPLNSSVAITLDKPVDNMLNVSSEHKINDDAEKNITHLDSIQMINKPLETDSDKAVIKSKDWKCQDCWVNNKAYASNCICCSAKNPTEENKRLIKYDMRKSEMNPETKWQSEKAQKNCGSNELLNPATIMSSGASNYKNPNANSPGFSPDIEQVTLSASYNEETSSSFKIRDDVSKNIFKEEWRCWCCTFYNNYCRSKCRCCGVKKRKLEDTEINFCIDHNCMSLPDKDDVNEAEVVPHEELQTNNNVLGTSTSVLLRKKTKDEKGAPKVNCKFAIPVEINVDLPNNYNLFKCASNQQEKSFNSTCTEKLSDAQNVDATNSFKISSGKEVTDAAFKIDISFTFTNSPLISSAESQRSSVSETPLLQNSNSVVFQILQTSEANESTPPQTQSPVLSFGHSSEKSLIPQPNPSSVTITETAAASGNNLISPSSMMNRVTLSERSHESFVSGSSLPQSSESVAMFEIPETSKDTESASSVTSPVFTFGHGDKKSSPPKFNFNLNKTEASQMFTPTFGVNTNSNPPMNPHRNENNNFTFETLSLPGNPLGNENISTGLFLRNDPPGSSGIPPENPSSITESSMCFEKNDNLQSNHPNVPSMCGESSQNESFWRRAMKDYMSPFVENPHTNTSQRASPFSFGIPTTSDTNISRPLFGNNNSNVFSIQNQNSDMQPLFQNSGQNPTSTSNFGQLQSINTSASVSDVFSNNVPIAGNIGVPNPTPPTFIEPSQNSTQFSAPKIFNFGAPQETSGIFAFGQQPVQPFQAPVLNSAVPNQNAPKFTIGTSRNTAPVRRIRKVTRRLIR